MRLSTLLLLRSSPSLLLWLGMLLLLLRSSPSLLLWLGMLLLLLRSGPSLLLWLGMLLPVSYTHLTLPTKRIV